MDAKLKEELLHMVETGRGSTTKELWLEVVAYRMNKRWPFKEPEDQEALRLILMGLSAIGQIVLMPEGWFLANAVPKTERRTFEEVRQQGLFA